MADGGKNKKGGRNKEWCKSYALRGTVDKNRLRRLARHAARHPLDEQTDAAVRRMESKRIDKLRKDSAWTAMAGK